LPFEKTHATQAGRQINVPYSPFSETFPFRQTTSFRPVLIDGYPHPIHRWAPANPEGIDRYPLGSFAFRRARGDG